MSRLQTVRENWTDITTKLLRDKQELANFLRFSASMYKQSFSDAVLIYQQNPNATKVATLETWNKLGRIVNKGEHSIAVFGEDSKSKHLFDISQTNGKRVPELWKLTEDLSADLTAVINEKYGKDCKNIQETIAAVAVDNIKSRLPDMQYLAQKLDIPFILGYYEHVLGLPMNFFGTRKVGEIVSRFTDASKIRDAISSATLTIMIDSLMAIVGGAVLYAQNSTLFVIAVIVVALYGVIVFAFKNPVKKINEKQMEDNAQVTSYLVETLNGIETVKAFHAEDKAQAKTDRLFVKLLKSVFKGGIIMNAQQTLTSAISTIGGTVILWVGVVNVLNGNMTLGSLITFNALLAYFLAPVKNLINLQPTMQTTIVAAERLAEILDLELEKTQNESRTLAPESLNLPIRIENLDFRYGTRRLVLENINMTINAGEKIALVGESGSGKTTLSKLLMNFYPWEKGEIFIGDYNLKDINLEALRNRIAYISQDIFLFSGTIKENLELGNEDATMEDIIEACHLSKADEFINNMPLRYETMLEENGANLSGGQKQRLAIARALLKKPDILIMDEATSNLDSITEKAIEKTINSLSRNITTIIIAHRLSTIMRCDKIFVMEQGKFIEQGTHSELIARKGRYYDLWKDQLPEHYTDTQEADTAEDTDNNDGQNPYPAFPVFFNPVM